MGGARVSGGELVKIWLPFIKEIHFFDRGSRFELDRGRRTGEFEDLQIVQRLRGRIRSKSTALIEDGSGQLQAIWFGRPYLGSQLHAGMRILVG